MTPEGPAKAAASFRNVAACLCDNPPCLAKVFNQPANRDTQRDCCEPIACIWWNNCVCSAAGEVDTTCG